MPDLPFGNCRRSDIQEEQYIFPYHYMSLFDDFYRKFTHRHYNSLIETIKEIVPIKSSYRILDAGCGDGRFSYEIKDTRAQIVGVDYSERAIAFARAFSPTVSFHCDDLSNLQDVASFDLVYCIEVIEHIPPQLLQAFIESLTVCLKPQGLLVISVPSKAIPISKKHFQHFTVEDIKLLFANDGMDIIKTEGHIQVNAWYKWQKKVKLAQWLSTFPILNRFTQRISNSLAKHFNHIKIATIDDCMNLIVVMQKNED